MSGPAHHGQALIQPTFKIHRIGTMPNGSPKVTSTTPPGLSPSAIQSVYHLSGLSAASNAGSGQIIAIVDAYNDPNALADLNAFNAQYGYPALSTCSSLTQAGACFEVAEPSGKPANNADLALEGSLRLALRQHRLRRPVRLVDGRRHQRRRAELGRDTGGGRGGGQYRAAG
jgi:hypothetical protein